MEKEPTKVKLKKKNPGGRPTKLTPEAIKKLEEVFAIDGSIAEACFYADISQQTYFNFVKRFPRYVERFNALRERPYLKARQTIVKALDDPNHAFRYMERKKKKEFGNTVDLTTNGKDLPSPIMQVERYVQRDSSDEEDKGT